MQRVLFLLVALILALPASAQVCSSGYCAASKADAVQRREGRNQNAICLRIVQERADAVVIRLFDKDGELLRLDNDGREMDRYRADLFPNGVGIIYPDRSIFNNVTSAVICNGKYSIELTLEQIRELLARPNDTCPPPKLHRACLASSQVCETWDSKQK